MNPMHKFMMRLALLGILGVALLAMALGGATYAQSGGTLGYGSRVFASLSPEIPTVAYGFSGSSGDFVTVLVKSWTGTLDAQIDLVAPNGVIVSHSTGNLRDDDPLGAHLAAYLPDDGAYVLRVSGQNQTTGDFTLTLLGRGAAAATSLAYGQAVDVTITPGAAAQFFAFEAEDCPTTLIITNPDPGQPFTFPFLAKVRDQRGQIVALLRGGEEMEDWLTVMPRSGRYEVEVLAADPTAAGSVRLLVTCAGDNPGCAAGPAIVGIPGVPEVCEECPPPDELVPGGGCPDLHFGVMQSPDNPHMATVTWAAMPDADGYAVYVFGLLAEGGEVYLTHATWNPGDPLSFTWVLPEVGYTGFRFVLRVYIGDAVVCVAETGINFERRMPVCAFFDVTIAEHTGTSVTFAWPEYPGADGYVLSLLDGTSRTLLPGWPVIVAASQLSYTVTDPPVTNFIFTVGPWDEERGGFCIQEQPAEVREVPDTGQYPCLIRTDRADVAVRVGPGTERSIFAWLNPGMEYPVLGVANDSGSAPWWQVDKTRFAGHDMVISLWVAASEVEEIGECDNVPPGEVPPVIPEDPGHPGGWQPCGSCDTCGHPASECVTSPEGACLWDPASCSGEIPPDDGSGCYAVSAAIDMGQCYGDGSAMLDVRPNCGSRYTPGTTISAHAVAVDGKCNVEYWSGCGASGGDNSITFTPGGSCVLTAHMWYGD